MSKRKRRVYFSDRSHQAPSNIRILNEREGISVKETFIYLLKSSRECACQRESLLQTKNSVFSLLEMADLKTLALRNASAA